MKKFTSLLLTSVFVISQTACAQSTTATPATQAITASAKLVHTVVTLEGSETAIEDKAYYQSNLSELTIKSPVTVIGAGAFEQSELSSVNIPGTVKEIKDRAFADCPLLWEVTFESKTPPVFGKNVFTGSDKITFYLPEGSDEKAWKKAITAAKGDSTFELYIDGDYADDGFPMFGKSISNSLQAAAPAEYAAADAAECEVVMPDFNTEEYNPIKNSGFVNVSTQPLSTFAMDVDTGSYTNFRRMVNTNTPLKDILSGAIRTEEMINYFDYSQGKNSAKSKGKFTVNSEMHPCPWNKDNDLLMLTVQANQTARQSTGNNFTYLIDTSGSMDSADKIGLAVESFKRLTENLSDKDTVSIVTYSGSSEVLLDSANAKTDLDKITNTLYSINCWGGTNGAGGIEAAYKLAEKNFKSDGNNRVIIASDGDMNLGITSQSGLVDLITEKKSTGIFLTTLGFGTGNYSDANMEQIADAGNGSYHYIDNLREAKRVLCDKLTQTTVTVAKDVKLQVEFNPAQVKSYRLIGYENRELGADEFRDDAIDGGECGAGQQITVFYELSNSPTGTAPTLKYQDKAQTTASDELLTLSVRYKEPAADVSVEENYPITNTVDASASADYNFATAVAGLSEILRGSQYIKDFSVEDVLTLAKLGENADAARTEFIMLADSIG